MNGLRPRHPPALAGAPGATTPRAAAPKLSVGVILMPRFTMIAFAAFVDALRLAADEDDRSRQIDCRWTVLGEDRTPVSCSNGVQITPWERFGDPERFDYLIVVGGLLHDGPRISPGVTEFLRLASARGVALVGICTGAFVLARMGLMAGYRSCVSWFHHQEFVAEFPSHAVVAHEMFVVDRDRLTCAGGRSAIHLAAYLIEKHCGRAAANKSLRILIEDSALPPRTPQPQPELATPTSDPRIRRAMWLMEQNLEDPRSIAQLAAAVNTSVRHLERSFRAAVSVSPQDYYMQLRLRHARRLIEQTTRPILDIAVQCGFKSSAHFCRRFRALFGAPASSLRHPRPAPPA